MSAPKSTKENCRRLAQRVVEDLDMDSLIEYAEDRMAEWYYQYCPKDIWKEEWELMFGDEEVS